MPNTFNDALKGKWALIQSGVTNVVVPVEIKAVVRFDDNTDSILVLAVNIDAIGAASKSSVLYGIDLNSEFYDSEADANDAAIETNNLRSKAA